MKITRFSVVYNSFLSKITDDMYLELTEEDTKHLLRQLLASAIPKFEFPRQALQFGYIGIKHPIEPSDDEEEGEQDPNSNTNEGQGGEEEEEQQYEIESVWAFTRPLTLQQVNILATYMIVQWLGQQLASVENTRMKYSGADFKFTSQANHMQKLLQMKRDYEREGFHLQRLYKRRGFVNGKARSTAGDIMSTPSFGLNIKDWRD